MAEHSTIEWTDATWNVVTGCTLILDGCRHCYAAELAATRLKNHPSRTGVARRNAAGEAKFTGEVRFNEQWLDQPLRWSRPRKIFVCAHGDLFHESVPDHWIDRVFAVMALARQHTFQVLTKRPERARAYLQRLPDRQQGERSWPVNPLEEAAHDVFENMGFDGDPAATIAYEAVQDWPLPNVWLGTSVEDQDTADARIPELLAAPAAVRFVSAEPLLGPVDLTGHLWGRAEPCPDCPRDADCDCGTVPRHMLGAEPDIAWVIAGGESGRYARPPNPQWFRDLRDQCRDAGVAFFFKQWGEWVSVSEVEGDGEHFQFPDGRTVRRTGKKVAGRTLDGELWSEMPR
ncbi:phage Gp37/Gp68 family protein [Pseudooceanicola sp.]|uniref:phage Gp37/Gp68 family protein n=1 Tax=Pseudooceanicola sp. TaxID=1914328 RepID=UPI004058FBBD